jgi:RNA polymerase sigma factor (sigma-70 family)
MVLTNENPSPQSDPRPNTQPNLPAPTPLGPHPNAPDYTALVTRVQANEQAALEELYSLFASGIRQLIIRAIGRQDLDDRLHDTFLAVVASIQKGELREPARLMGYVRVVVKRQLASYFEKYGSSKREHVDVEGAYTAPKDLDTPQEVLERKQNQEIVERVMRSMSRRDREILTRFYLMDQSMDQICQAMDLNENQFRLLKSRAKRRFSEEGRRRLQKNNLRSLFVRTFSS